MRNIDGSRGEGGGSILRIATALAAVTQEPIEITNIRKKRPKPGLKAQHLMGLQALADFCGGSLENAYLGSEAISFFPTNDWKSHLKIHVATAGSIGLILQTLQIAKLANKSLSLTVEFQGGATFGKWAPSIPYVDHVTWTVLRMMGCQLELTVGRHGFFPKGGAKVGAKMTSMGSLNGLKSDEFQAPNHATVLSFASEHLKKAHVADRQSKTVVNALKGRNIATTVYNEIVPADNPGSGILVFSHSGDNIIGGDFVGERKLRAEQVGQNAVERYIKVVKSKSTVDPLCADQILPIMACATSSSVFTTPYISNHTKTNIRLIQELLDVTITPTKEETNYLISVDL
ncbi:MAG: RNA 3'-terminal phosphate cyclase [Candidatus Thorarchaeota archaeon]